MKKEIPLIKLKCTCKYYAKRGKWEFCDTAKRLFKDSQKDFKLRDKYDKHFKR